MTATAFEHLLREGRIGRMTVRNRIIMAPMARQMNNRDGTITQAYVDLLAERARGGAGLIMTEGAYVDAAGNTQRHAVGCHDDALIPGLRRLADAVHAHGAKLGIELYLGGRVTPATGSYRQPVSASGIACAVLDPTPVPRALTTDEIDDVVRAFAAGATRAVAAGIDMIHLHGASGYLLTEFLSPFTNRRTDAYGGSLAGRARLALEVVAAVRDAVGPEVPIGYRLTTEEFVEGGLELPEAVEFATLLADAGIDLIDVTAGIYETGDLSIQGAGAPRGPFVGNARAIKAAVGDRVPVSVVQRLNDPHDADEVLRREAIDFVSMARAFHADPHYVRKLAEQRSEDIVPCIGCLHCLDLQTERLPVRCAVNPATGLERRRSALPAPQARRVVVVGGGAAGMQAARLTAEQGHAVTLFERDEALGGQLRHAARVASDYGLLVGYLERQLAKLGVDVRLGAGAGLADVLDERPDAVVVATGARGGAWFCPVDPEARTFDLFAAFERADEEWNERVAVIGGDYRSCSLALHAARRGATVHVVEPRAELAWDKLPLSGGRLLSALEQQPAVELHTESTVERVGAGFVVVQRGGELRQVEVDTVISGDTAAENALYEQLATACPALELYAIGDASSPRDVFAATHDAADVAEWIRVRTSEQLVRAQREPAVAAG